MSCINSQIADVSVSDRGIVPPTVNKHHYILRVSLIETLQKRVQMSDWLLVMFVPGPWLAVLTNQDVGLTILLKLYEREIVRKRLRLPARCGVLRNKMTLKRALKFLFPAAVPSFLYHPPLIIAVRGKNSHPLVKPAAQRCVSGLIKRYATLRGE